MMVRSRTQERMQSYSTLQNIVKDLEYGIGHAKASPGKKLSSSHVQSVLRLRTIMQQTRSQERQTNSLQSSPINDKLLYEVAAYTSLKNQNGTFPKSEMSRATSLLLKSQKELGLGYHQQIGQSHQLLPTITSQCADFSQSVARNKVSFLKEQIKYFDQKEEQRRQKIFASIRRDLNREQNKVTFLHRYDDQLPTNNTRIGVETRALRKNFRNVTSIKIMK